MLSNNPDRVWNPVRVDKLWYFAHNLQMEQESDLVALGKLTHEEHYTRDTSKEEFAIAGIK
ncbi:MAG: Dna2/Cas4 domain-containing protein, partial [bacterium]